MKRKTVITNMIKPLYPVPSLSSFVEFSAFIMYQQKSKTRVIQRVTLAILREVITLPDVTNQVTIPAIVQGASRLK